jgi:ribonuclease HI
MNELQPQICSIYTDGSHCPETNKGGWGVIICYEDGSVLEFGGSVPSTRIIRMELYAAVNTAGCSCAC